MTLIINIFEMIHPTKNDLSKLRGSLSEAILMSPKCQCTGNCKSTVDLQFSLKPRKIKH